jgi:NitT/TauT family transport system permease protein
MTPTAAPRAFAWATRLARYLFIVGILVLLQILTRNGSISELVLPPPTDIATEVWRQLGTDRLYSDLGQTGFEVGISVAGGIILGLALGVFLWRLRTAGQAFEPFLATLYAMPVVVFYPTLLVLFGLGAAPIILLSTIMVIVPVSLNTATGLREVSPILVKLGRSLNCSRFQLYGKVMFPAAIPFIVPGIRLGIIYGVTGTVVMELILADKGIGFRIGDDYNNFAVTPMWAGIVIVMVLCTVIVAGVDRIARRLRRDLGGR